MRAPWLALLLVPLLAGCTLGEPAPPAGPAPPSASEAPGPLAEVGSDAQLRVDAAFPQLDATRGRRVEAPVALGCSAAPAARVEARLVGSELAGAWVSANLTRACHAVLFAPLDVPPNATLGAHALAVEVRDANGTLLRRAHNETLLRVVEPAARTWTDGDFALVAYTGRFAETDQVFYTNERALATLPYERAPGHRAGRDPLALSVSTTALVPPGFLRAMEGMSPGETRVVTLPPHEAYGEARVLVREAREETIPRDEMLDANVESIAWDTFAEHVRSTGQGNPETFEVGDRFLIEQGGNAWPHEIVARTPERVDYRLRPEVGQRFTLWGFWPGASEVVAVTDDHVALYTTPPHATGDSFTMRAEWPNMTTVVAIEEGAVRVRHAPPEGHAWNATAEGGARYVARVAQLTDAHVVIERPNPHPLAGRELVFAIRLVELR